MNEFLNSKKNSVAINLAIILFIFTVITGSSLPGFEISGVGKLFPARMIMPFIFLYFIVKYKMPDKFTVKCSLFLCMWLIVMAMGLLWATNREIAMKSMINYCYGFMLIYILLIMTRQYKNIDSVVICIGNLFILLMILGIFEGITGKYFFDATDEYSHIITIKNLHYPLTVFGGPNEFSFFTILLFPLYNAAINLKTQKGHVKRSAIKVLYLGLSFAIAAIGECRMGILVLACLLFVYVFLRFKKTMSVLICTIFMLFIILEFTGTTNIIAKLLADARIDIWLNILKNAKVFYFMGVGVGNSAVPIAGVIYEGMFSNPHFWFLEMFVEFGLPFFILLLGCYISIFRKSGVGIQNNNQRAKACFVILLIFIPMSIMSSSLSNNLNFWFMMACFLCYYRQYSMENNLLKSMFYVKI